MYVLSTCILNFDFCIPRRVITTKSVISTHHHTVDPIDLFPQPHFTSSGNCYPLFYICVCFCLLIYLKTFLYSTYEWNRMVFVFWRLTYFTKCNIHNVHPCCCKWQDFIFVLWLSSFHCVCGCVCVCVWGGAHFFVHRWALRLFSYFDYCK